MLFPVSVAAPWHRAFALAFWPDPRGSTPKALAALIRDEDPSVYSPDNFATVSVAARGFYALEFLLFDEQTSDTGNPEYICALIKAISTDIAANSAAIFKDWASGYGDLISNAGNETYRSDVDAVRQLFTALSSGLEFTSEARLGRPMGTFEKPRPKRAEARRSERSLRHVVLSLKSTQQLAALISSDDVQIESAFAGAIQRAENLEDPTFTNVSNPQGRFRVEDLKQSIDRIRQLLAEKVGPRLGITAGFNSLDGD